MKFEDLDILQPLKRAVKEIGYETPTPIQEKAIPVLLERKDLCGIAQTGTGKTAAFALPILQLLLESGNFRSTKCARALILLPTRELAIQVADCFEKYAKFTAMNVACVFGGVSDIPQKRSLLHGVDVLVATPGRLLDLIAQKAVSLRTLEFFVLDEADRMLDMGFIHDIKKVIALLPAKRQNLFFSATMPPEIAKLAASILGSNPVRIEVTPQSTPIERIKQVAYHIEKRRKTALLKELLNTRPEMKKVLVFSRTKHGANKISEALEKSGITCAAIHGNKSQTRRQEALGNFKCEQIRVLVATDIAARGIDVDDVTHVINYDLPNEAETFVHRIGRTARAGKDGEAIAFCCPEDEQNLKLIEKVTRVKLPEGDHSIYANLPELQPLPPQQNNQKGKGHGKGNAPRNTPQGTSENPNASTQQQQRQGGHKKQKKANKPLATVQQNSMAGVPQGNAANAEFKQHKKRKNRPGSKARKRIRESGAQV